MTLRTFAGLGAPLSAISGQTWFLRQSPPAARPSLLLFPPLFGLATIRVMAVPGCVRAEAVPVPDNN